MPRDAENRRLYHAKYMKMRYQTDPEFRKKQNARTKVPKAIKAGLITKLPCCDCGSKESQAHHKDYEQPLDVIWLCRSCHEKQHGGPGCHL